MSDFPGFKRPRYTQIPNDFLDLYMHDLSGAELKVLLYIMRRTLGFGKTADNISLDQFTDGIVRADGVRTDHGAGVSRPSAKKALASLAQRGFIDIVENMHPSGRQLATTYRLRVQDEDEDAVETAVKEGANFFPPTPFRRGKFLSGKGQVSAQSGGKDVAPQKKVQNKRQRERDRFSDRREKRPPLSLAEMHQLDPVADRDLILRARIRPEPPRDARTIDVLTEWQLLGDEWDRRNGR